MTEKALTPDEETAIDKVLVRGMWSYLFGKEKAEEQVHKAFFIGPPPPVPEVGIPSRPDEVVYRVIDRQSGEAQPVYCRDYRDETDFESYHSAVHARHDGAHKDRRLYKVAKYRVKYELIEDDCTE